MSLQYSGGLEVYKACQKVFDELFLGCSKFKDSIVDKGYCTINVGEDFNIDVEGVSYNDCDLIPNAFKGVRDEEYDEELGKITDICFGSTFLYEDGYLYLNEVTVDDDSDYSSVRCVDDYVDGYPRPSEVLVPRGNKYKDVTAPKSFCGIFNLLYTHIKQMNGNSLYGGVMKFYMDGDIMRVCVYQYYDEYIDILVTCDKVVFDLCSKLVGELKGFGKPVKEVYVMMKSDMSRVRFRKQGDGEYTLVVC